MSSIRVLLTIVSIVVLVFLTASIYPQKPSGPAYKTVHLLKLTTSKAENDLLKGLGEANKLFGQLGYPNIRYRVWKVSGTPSGGFTHLWESEWPDKSAYDKIHELKEFTDSWARYEKEFEAIEKDQVYNRFEEMPIVATKK